MALWANLSPEVDARLTQNLAAPIKLRPDEWRSGPILWLVDIIGDQAVFDCGPVQNYMIPDAPEQLRDNRAHVIVMPILDQPGVSATGPPPVQWRVDCSFAAAARNLASNAAGLT